MKVLLVGDYPPPSGGIATHVEQLHRWLLSRGVQSKVLDVGKGAHSGEGVVPARGWIRYALQLLQFAARGWLPHAHVSGDNRNSWLVIASVVVAARLFGRRPLVTLHSGFLPSSLPQTPARRRLARAVLARCGRVIAVSEAIREALEALGAPAHQVAVYPAFLASQARPGLPPNGFGAVRSSCRPLLAMADHPSPIYGRRIAYQALKLIARDFPSVGLALFGPGLRCETAKAEALADGVAGRVHDFGELEQPAVLGVMSRCDVFLRPTTGDGDSLSVREALALGVRCVASDASVRPPGALLFRCGDGVDLARKIRRALAEPSPIARPVDVGPVLLAEYQRSFSFRRLPRFGGASARRKLLGSR